MTTDPRSAAAEDAVRPVGRASVGLVGKATTIPIGHLLGDSVVPTPQGTSRRSSLRLPAFWLLVVALAIGLWRMSMLVSAAFVRFPVATVVAAALFILYAVPFVIVARSIDFFEPEPALLVGAAVGWGAVVATMTAISGNTAARAIVAKLVSPAFATAWGPAIIGPTLEEVLKTLGVVVIVLVARRQVNSVADGAVYGAFVGLGFQCVENFVDAVQRRCPGRARRQRPTRHRHILVCAVSSPVCGATRCSPRWPAPVWRTSWCTGATNRSCDVWVSRWPGVAGAWLFHFVWNSPWFADGFGYGGLGVLAGLLVKGAPALVLIALLVRSASGREADFYVARC